METYSGYRSSRRDPEGAQHLLNPSANDQEIGAAVLDALQHSRFVLPEEAPELYDYKSSQQRYAAWVAALMERYAYKTKRALFKNMKNCSIKSVNDVIIIKPSFHEKLEMWTGDGIKEEDHVSLTSPAHLLRLVLASGWVSTAAFEVGVWRQTAS